MPARTRPPFRADRIADELFGRMAADAFFLEYYTARAGSFEPLRFVPQDKIAVLGLMSTKVAELEPIETLRRRVDEAAKHVDIARLCLSSQCGFASSYKTDRLTPEQQERKLAHLVEAAARIWE